MFNHKTTIVQGVNFELHNRDAAAAGPAHLKWSGKKNLI